MLAPKRPCGCPAFDLQGVSEERTLFAFPAAIARRTLARRGVLLRSGDGRLVAIGEFDIETRPVRDPRRPPQGLPIMIANEREAARQDLAVAKAAQQLFQ